MTPRLKDAAIDIIIVFIVCLSVIGLLLLLAGSASGQTVTCTVADTGTVMVILRHLDIRPDSAGVHRIYIGDVTIKALGSESTYGYMKVNMIDPPPGRPMELSVWYPTAPDTFGIPTGIYNEGVNVELLRQNDARWDYLDISYRHFRFEPFTMHKLHILSNGLETGCAPYFNMDWFRDRGLRPNQIFIITCERYIPYPRNWELTDNGIAWVIADTAIDGQLNGVSDYFEFDYTGDGYIDLSDLTFFGADYGTGRRWDLSDFTAMGQIYNTRRAR